MPEEKKLTFRLIMEFRYDAEPCLLHIKHFGDAYLNDSEEVLFLEDGLRFNRICIVIMDHNGLIEFKAPEGKSWILYREYSNDYEFNDEFHLITDRIVDDDELELARGSTATCI